MQEQKMQLLDSPEQIGNEKILYRVADQPIRCTLPGYRGPFEVIGIARRTNYKGGQVLTLAVGTWTIEGRSRTHTINDIATMMKLADLLSHLHPLPVNADRLYGPRGRGCEVGRNRHAPNGT